MIYNLVLFVHIAGALLMFAAIGMTIFSMGAMLRAEKTEIVRIWARVAVKLDGLMPLSALLLLLPGLYLTYTAWGWGVAWINVSLVTLLVMCFLGPIINLRRLKEILDAANTETELMPSAELTSKVTNRVLWNSVCIMTMLVVTIVFLMTVKAGMIGSLIAIAAGIGAGLLLSALMLKREPVSTAVTPE